MTTNIRIQVKDGGLIRQVKNAQIANRKSLVNQESDQKFLADVKARKAAQVNEQAVVTREGAVPEYGIKEQTSAQRGGDIIAGLNGSIQRRIEIGASNFNTLTFTVAEPADPSTLNQDQKTSITKNIFHLFGSVPELPPSSYTDTITPDLEGVTYPGRARAYGSTTTNGNVFWYEVSVLGAPGFSPVPQPIPYTRTVVNTQYSYSTVRNYRSQYYILPIQKDRAIFVYHGKSEVLVEVLRDSTTTQNVMSIAETYPNALTFQEDETGTVASSVDSVNVERLNSYLCFVYSKDKLRELEVPQLLKDKLDLLLPNLSLTLESTQRGSTSTRTTRAYLKNPPSAFSGYYTDILAEQQTPNFFNRNVFNYSASQGPYGSVPELNQILAKQFGMGSLKTNYHGSFGKFYSTPAVYSYLKGDMNLISPLTKEYSYMREEFFNNAPKRYIDVNLDDELTNYKLHHLTRQTPVNIEQAMPAQVFKKVRLGYRGIYNGWDWGDPNYCRQQLLALGFTNADLTP